MVERIPRPMAAAGRFYPEQGVLLLRQIEACYAHPLGPHDVHPVASNRPPRALIVPHGALGHAGPVTAHAFALLEGWWRAAGVFPARVVLLGPDHFGLGARVSATGQDYGTPLGYLPTALNLVKSVCAAAEREHAGSGLAVAEAGHHREHSLENVLPFLQHQARMFAGGSAPTDPPWLFASPELLPLTVGALDYAAAERLGALLAACLPDEGTLLIATSDLCHCGPLYGNCPVPGESAGAFCRNRIEHIAEVLETFDAERLVATHHQEAWSLCGITALAATLHWARLHGASEVRRLQLSDSIAVARAWENHPAIPRNDSRTLRYPWNLLAEVDASNPVGFGSFALL